MEVVRGLDVGVDGLEFCGAPALTPVELADDRVLTGVDDLVGPGRETGVNGLVAVSDPARLPGVEGLEVTEAELVLRTEVLLLLER